MLLIIPTERNNRAQIKTKSAFRFKNMEPRRRNRGGGATPGAGTWRRCGRPAPRRCASTGVSCGSTVVQWAVRNQWGVALGGREAPRRRRRRRGLLAGMRRRRHEELVHGQRRSDGATRLGLDSVPAKKKRSCEKETGNAARAAPLRKTQMWLSAIKENVFLFLMGKLRDCTPKYKAVF